MIPTSREPVNQLDKLLLLLLGAFDVGFWAVIVLAVRP